MSLPESDIRILRNLAKRVAEIGRLPVQEQKAERWRDHNDLKHGRPLVLVFPEGAWREMLPGSSLTCVSEFARNYEYDLRVRLYYWEHMQDDNVIEPVIASPIVMYNTGWGLEGAVTRPDDPVGAFHIDPVLRGEADVEKLRIPEITVDWPATEERFNMMQEVFGGILAVEKQGQCNFWVAPIDHYSQLRGIDQMFFDLVERPGFVHRVVGRIVDGHIAMLKSMEQQGALSLGNRRHYAGSGGTGYTRELPGPGFAGKHVRTMGLWGFATAQIFAEVSPAMHEEFALRQEKRVLDLFGLNCYGCCEPLHHKLKIVKTIPRLRRISISPWADVEKSAEELGDRYVYSWKPNPAAVAAEHWNPEAVRADIRSFLQKTRGCVVEMIMKDTHTCRHQPQRMWDWVRIAKEEANAFA